MPPSSPTPARPGIQRNPVPTGIELQPVPEPAAEPSARVLLVERHERPASGETLHRVVRRIPADHDPRRSEPVELLVSDPDDTVTLHHVRIVRNGTVTDLGDAIDFRPQGGDAPSYVGDIPSQAAGDLIDVAYSIRAAVPVFEGNSSCEFALSWPLPIAEAILTVTQPPASKSVLLNSGLGSEPRRESLADGGERFVWHLRNLQPLPPDPTIPTWHSAAPRVQLSDYSDWNAVAARVYTIWEPALREGANAPAIRERVDALREAHPTPESFAQAAIHFVQDHIAASDPAGSARLRYRPVDPAEVLARGSGDAKDRALVLCTLLRAGGVAAFPVLVNSRLQHAISGFLPSPGAFDHLVTCIRFEKQYFWADPSIRAQGGTLESRVLPRFVFGLLVHPKSKGLVRLPKPTPESGEKVVQEDFAIDYMKRSAVLTVLVGAQGTEADLLREEIARAGTDGIGAALLDAYRRPYPDAEASEPVHIEDERDENHLVLRIAFRIPDFVEYDRRSRNKILRLPGHAIQNLLASTTESKREHPLHLRFPNRVLQIVTANIPDSARFEKRRVSVDCPAFQFHSTVQPHSRSLEVRYYYGASSHRVDPSEFPLYLDRIHRVTEALNPVFSIPTVSFASKHRKLLTTTGIAAAATALFFILRVILGDSKAPPPAFDNDFNGISVVDEPVDQDLTFDQNVEERIRASLNDTGVAAPVGPSLLDASEFEFSLDPGTSKSKPSGKTLGIPSLTD